MEHIHVLQQKLEHLRTEVEQALTEIAVHNPETDDWEVTTAGAAPQEADSNLLADVAEAADERVSTLAELENQYQGIVRALKKISAGTYGTCEVGGEPIEIERLMVNPAARTCILHREEEYRIPL